QPQRRPHHQARLELQALLTRGSRRRLCGVAVFKHGRAIQSFRTHSAAARRYANTERSAASQMRDPDPFTGDRYSVPMINQPAIAPPKRWAVRAMRSILTIKLQHFRKITDDAEFFVHDTKPTVYRRHLPKAVFLMLRQP